MFLLRNEIYVMTGLNKDKVSFTSIISLFKLSLYYPPGKGDQEWREPSEQQFLGVRDLLLQMGSDIQEWKLRARLLDQQADHRATAEVKLYTLNFSNYWGYDARYAHQLVYNEENGVHFMFGGNPGGKENRNGKLRLGDFWRLELERQQNTDLERVLIKEIRKAR